MRGSRCPRAAGQQVAADNREDAVMDLAVSPLAARAVAGPGGPVRQGRGVELVLVHVLAHRPALPRPAA